MFLMDLIDSFRASQSNWMPDAKQVVPGLSPEEALENYGGLPPSLAHQRRLDAIWLERIRFLFGKERFIYKIIWLVELPIRRTGGRSGGDRK